MDIGGLIQDFFFKPLLRGITMKKIILGFFGVSLFLMSCATIQQKMGGLVLKMMTKKEKDFNNIAAIGQYQRNLYPADVGISTLGTENWETGQNSAGVQLIKADGAIGVIELDGTVTVDGETATYYGGGVYGVLYDHDDLDPKTVKIVNADGQEAEFEIAPPPYVAIKSINGATENATLDLTKPLELELDYNAAAEGKRVKVALITNAVGAKGFANFQSFPVQSKVTIPADAFKHKHVSGGGPTGKEATKWMTGENHIQITLVEEDRSVSGMPFPYFKKAATIYDTKPVTVTGSTEGRAYIRANGEYIAESGKFKYGVTSSNAWYARPLNSGNMKIGIASVSVEGVLYRQETSESTSTDYYQDYKVITTTTTTTTFQFPQLDDMYWDQFLENIYSDMVSMMENEYGNTVVDVDQITSNPIYDEFYEPKDENTEKYISKNLRDTKRLFPATLGEALADRKTIMIADADPMPTLLRDMGMDALMSISIDYRVAANKEDKIVLLPLVSYQVTGQNQGYDGSSSAWLQGSFEGPGVPFDRDEFSDLNALNRIGQKDVILGLIRQSIEEMTSRQSEFGYDKIWEVAAGNKNMLTNQ